MNMPVGGWIRILVLALVAAAPVAAAAQAYPTKPIRIVVPFAPGGASDVLARLVGQKLSERLGQPVIVENKPGATTTLGAAEVAKAPADGYTLMLAPAPFVIAPLMYQKLAYDAAKDFTGVALMASSPLILTVHPSVGVSTPQELLALGKAKPGTVMYGSPGSGSVPHLATELFKLRTGTDFTHVPYKGGGPAIVDLVGGQVNMMFATPIEVAQHVQAGRLNVLGATAKKRLAAFPNVPTLDESGYPGFEVASFFGVLAPAGTPPEIVGKLAADLAAVMETQDVREKFAAQSAEANVQGPDAFAKFLDAERDKWADIVRRSGAKVD